MFKKLFYVVRISRQKSKAKKQTLVEQVKNTYQLLDASMLSNVRNNDVKLNSFIMPVTNVDELLQSLKQYNKLLPLYTVKSKDVPNGNFTVNLESFMVTENNYYVDIVPTIEKLKQLVLKICEYLLPVQKQAHGVGETNMRMLKGMLIHLLAFALILHEAIIELM